MTRKQKFQQFSTFIILPKKELIHLIRRHTLSVSRCSRRWPLRVLYGILDQAGINAFTLFKIANNAQQMKRKTFLKNLALQLCAAHVNRRLEQGNLWHQLSTKRVADLKKEDDEEEIAGKKLKRSRCYVCPRKKDNKVSTVCKVCKKPVCRSHQKVTCPSCN